MSGFKCVNCGDQNSLGDVCPLCCLMECDKCGETIDFDADFYDEETDTRMCEGCAIEGVLQ
jgi:hypothetical protein